MPGRQLKNSRLNSTHHFVVNRDQQGAGSDPGERAGNADGSVSDHTGKSYVAVIRITSSIMQAANGARPFCILWMEVR